ncbi:MAG: serine--tRNA ligase, partial [Patescibacteria group bacterium]|nr:serine--tRNA ligase [Patescibacteria group bacterium]
NYILENPKEMKENAKNRGIKVNFDKISTLANQRKELIIKIDDNRRRQKEISEAISKANNRDELIKEAKVLKEETDCLEKALEEVAPKLKDELLKVPNITHPEAPIGKGEEDNKVIEEIGKKPEFPFEPKGFDQLMSDLDLIDFERGAKVAGQKFYYLKGDGALLEFALINYALDLLVKEGFTPYITPDLASGKIIEGAGFAPRGPEAQIYYIDGMDLGLIATAEINLVGLHSDEVLDEKELPKKIAGFSHCFRREAGTYGKQSKGIYRVHQFSKVEMFIYSKPEESDKMHQKVLEIEKNIFKGLGIPFRVVDCCTVELAGPAYRKFDLEAWLPAQEKWGEITSTTNATDFQARRVSTKYKNSEGKTEFVHMINGTAIAVSRAMVAIMENYQKEDGSVEVPKVLQKWLNKKVVKK